MTTLKKDEEDDVKVLYVTIPRESPSLKRKRRTSSRSRNRRFECLICLEDDIEGCYGYTLHCSHRFCLPCLSGLVQSATTTATAEPLIPCPEPKCKKPITAIDIQYIFRDEPNKWNAFSQKRNEAWIESQLQEGGGIMRRCPAERCNYAFVHELRQENAVGTHFQCPLCNNSFCLDCPANNGNVGPSHTAMTCEERRQELVQKEKEREKLEQWKVLNAQADQRFKELLENERIAGTTKNCPRCNASITKNGGCNHMRCRCGHDYNWSTGQPLS